MSVLTFKGGVHPDDKKRYTKDKSVIYAPTSKLMVYPLSQHIGAPCEPTVSVGDYVRMGQKIADSKAYVSAPIHSTVSGKIVSIEKKRHPNGNMVDSIIIENDFLDKKVDDIHKRKKFTKLAKDEKLDVIRQAGIVGLGGACFPTHIKLNPDKKIDCIIVNGAECEPYLTNDYRLMLENSDEIINGIRYMMDIVSCNKAYIAIEDNKPEAIKLMKEKTEAYPAIEVVTLKTKYPQGSEKHLIYAVIHKEVPSGGLPMDVGVVVDNIATCISVFRACDRREPLMERVITFSGNGISQQNNICVRIGTNLLDIIDFCGGLKSDVKKVLAGGPMMGTCLFDLDIPTIKGTSAVLFLNKKEAEVKNESQCIRCGKCVNSCPMKLLPGTINMYAKNNDFENCLKYDIMDCIECGVCTYLCQSGQNIVQNIKNAKAKIKSQNSKK